MFVCTYVCVYVRVYVCVCIKCQVVMDGDQVECRVPFSSVSNLLRQISCLLVTLGQGNTRTR